MFWLELIVSDGFPLEDSVEGVTLPLDLGQIAPGFEPDKPSFYPGDSPDPLPYEVETDGERTVYWVHFPRLGPGDTLRVEWGETMTALAPQGPIWPQSLGIWHLTELESCSECSMELTWPVPGSPTHVDQGVQVGAVRIPPVTGALRADGYLTPPFTMSAWVQLDTFNAGSQIFTGGVGDFSVDQCSLFGESVGVVASGESSLCVPVDLEAWNFYALRVKEGGFILTVNDQEVILEKSGGLPDALHVLPGVGGEVDELRVFAGERRPEQLLLDYWSGRQPVFELLEASVVVEEADPGQLLPEDDPSFRARWSGGCETARGPLSGALALITLRWARRKRP